jgi:hypothetical protein
MTVEEVVRQLESDPVYVAERDKRKARRLKRVEANLRVQAPILADLANAGFVVDSLNEFCLRKLTPDERAVVPILLRWIPRLDNLDIKSTIARALRDKTARPIAGPPLAKEYRTVQAPSGETEVRFQHYKWQVANTIAMLATEVMFDEIVELVEDQRHGWSREPFAIALQRMKNPRAIDVLINALDEDLELDRSDCALTISSIRALGNRKVLQARGKIEKFLAHRERVVQKEAQRSLKKLDRAKAKAREKGLSGTTLNGSTT